MHGDVRGGIGPRRLCFPDGRRELRPRAGGRSSNNDHNDDKLQHHQHHILKYLEYDEYQHEHDCNVQLQYKHLEHEQLHFGDQQHLHDDVEDSHDQHLQLCDKDQQHFQFIEHNAPCQNRQDFRPSPGVALQQRSHHASICFPLTAGQQKRKCFGRFSCHPASMWDCIAVSS
eukprot:s2503_g6.t1